MKTGTVVWAATTTLMAIWLTFLWGDPLVQSISAVVFMALFWVFVKVVTVGANWLAGVMGGG